LQVIFAALGRYLSLNTTKLKFDSRNWDSLTRELSVMALAYLTYDGSGALNEKPRSRAA
jgi:hypothetical protein